MGISYATPPSENNEQFVDQNAVYLIDFTKITSVNDLVLILASIGFSFSPYHPHFEQLKPFLALDNPIPVQQTQQSIPATDSLKLPKITKIK
jgi:hypothetical protein